MYIYDDVRMSIYDDVRMSIYDDVRMSLYDDTGTLTARVAGDMTAARREFWWPARGHERVLQKNFLQKNFFCVLCGARASDVGSARATSVAAR